MLEDIQHIIPPTTLLRLYAESQLSRCQGLSSEEKFQLIGLDQADHEDPKYTQYIQRGAMILDQLQEQGTIRDWIYSRPKNFGELFVDFLIVRRDSAVVAINVTSTWLRGRERRKIISQFGPNGLSRIGVVQLLTISRRDISDEEANRRFTTLIEQLTPIGSIPID